MPCVSQREAAFVTKKGINLLQALEHTLFVLLHVVSCSSGVMRNFHLFLLLKLLNKQQMTVALRRLSLGDTQMFILHYFLLS